MKRNASVLLLAGGALALAVWQLAPANGSGSASHATQEAAVAPSIATEPTKSTAPATGAGYVVHLDESGQLVEEPTAGSIEEMNTMLGEMINTSHEGLVAVDSPIPGGGVMIDLQGRFQNASVATVDGSGRVVAPCLSNENEAGAFTSSVAARNAAAKE